MSTIQRLKDHMDKNGKEYYEKIIAETKRVLKEKKNKENN